GAAGRPSQLAPRTTRDRYRAVKKMGRDWGHRGLGFGRVVDILPFVAEHVTRMDRRYKSKRELTRALRLIARADLELRSQPPDKKLVLERLVMNLASEAKSVPEEGSSHQIQLSI